MDELIGKTDEDMHWHIENGPFHDDEVEVLTQGKSIIGARGTCIVDEKIYTKGRLEDPAIGLNNLRGLAENMNHDLEEFWHHGRKFCVMGFYIKEYETFCRTFGDTAGNVYLKAIGKALQDVFDHRAILAYVIDGQFYVIMQYENPENMHKIQQEAVRHIESIHHVGEWRCTCTAKITLSYVNEENAGVFRYE